jgi:hypothetical protein
MENSHFRVGVCRGGEGLVIVGSEMESNNRILHRVNEPHISTHLAAERRNTKS